MLKIATRMTSATKHTVVVLALLFAAKLGSCKAFQIASHRPVVLTSRPSVVAPTNDLQWASRKLKVQLDMSKEESEDVNEAPKRKRRRKRKVESETSESSTTIAASIPEVELKPRDEAPVQMEVVDVREAVGMKSIDDEKKSENPFASINPMAAFTSSQSESAPSPPMPSTMPADAGSVDDSLRQLLEDARQMQEDDETVVGDKEGGGLKAKIRDTLGTIVTVDFFVVCGFLLWFLLGIFCSSVLKDDTVQIAFNSNFQAFVQPALGILMIGSIAGNVLKEEEQEEVF